MIFRLSMTLTQRLNVTCEADNEDENKLQTANLQTLESEYRQILTA